MNEDHEQNEVFKSKRPYELPRLIFHNYLQVTGASLPIGTVTQPNENFDVFNPFGGEQ
jgi:hypothetical protein